jgi:hypothetical protein
MVYGIWRTRGRIHREKHDEEKPELGRFMDFIPLLHLHSNGKRKESRDRSEENLLVEKRRRGKTDILYERKLLRFFILGCCALLHGIVCSFPQY